MYRSVKVSRWFVAALCIAVVVFIFVMQVDDITSFANNKSTDIHRQEPFKLLTANELAFIKSKLQVEEPVLNKTQVSELEDKYDIAVPHLSLNWTEQDMTFFRSAAGEALLSQLTLIPEAKTIPNFAQITTGERLFKTLFIYFDKIFARDPDSQVETDPRFKESWALFKRLEGALFPWIHPYWDNVFHINNQTEGRGLIICVGNNQFPHAAVNIRTIREIYNNTLPIEVFFIRDSDLSEAKRSYLINKFDGISLMKLEDYVGEYYTKFGGWAMKPFAMLASKFQEMIMLDADVFFFQDPIVLFGDNGYKTTGSLFYYDRTLFPNWTKGPDWMRSFLPSMSSFVPNSRWFKGLSSHEQESGVIVMDRRKSLLGLLGVCKMNSVTEREEVVYKHVHGDKETFWIGYEMMQAPYAFVKSFGAVVGSMGRGGEDGSPDHVCGNELHLDANGQPLWWNGGLYRNKHSKDKLEYLNFKYFAEGNEWEFPANCIKDTDRIQELSPQDQEFAMRAVEFDEQRIADGIIT